MPSDPGFHLGMSFQIIGKAAGYDISLGKYPDPGWKK